MCSVINKSAVPSWHPSKYTLLRNSKAAPATVWQQEELWNYYKQMSLASLPATGVTALSVCKTSTTHGPPESLSLSPLFCPCVTPLVKMGSVELKGNSQLLAQAHFDAEDICSVRPRREPNLSHKAEKAAVSVDVASL